MQRVTISIDDDLLSELDAFAGERGYASRSEALRDVVRDFLASRAADSDERCVATVSYVYDHERRDLSRRLAQLHHDHHHLSLATLHVHLDHHDCLEIGVLRGKASDVRALANAVTSQTGVRHGRLDVIPESRLPHIHHEHGGHSHGGDGRGDEHA
ncbi:MAG: nickel-responsive transcriptional regulator NikR [Bauldia sp.]|nr:nickel-responsive transcriptional regulator NikR [Bauldia sp.]